MKCCPSCEISIRGAEWICPECGWKPEIREGFLLLAPNFSETSLGFSSASFQTLALLEDRHFWFRARNQLLCWGLKHYFPEAVSFLEVGCGTGFVLTGLKNAFPGLHLFGCDPFIEGLEIAKDRLPGVTLFRMDARKIPFHEEFDVAGAFDVIEHIEEDEEVLAQLFKATKIGGGILITVPQHPFLWSRSDEYGFHKRRYKKSELVEKVQRAGFRVVMTTSFVTLLLPVMVLSRLRSQKLAQNYDPLTELKIGAFANTIFEQLMTLESYFIKRGLSLPVGGSLLLIARKD